MYRVVFLLLSSGAACGLMQCSSFGQDPVSAGAWAVTADALWLRRDFGTQSVLAELQSAVAPPQTPTAPPPRILSNSLDFQYEPGIRVQLTRTLNEGDSLQIQYFGLQDLESGPTRLVNPDPNGNTVQLFSPGLIGVFDGAGGPGRSITASQSTEVRSAEFNVRRQLFCGATSVLAGFRYFRVEDELTLFGESSLFSTETSTARASNDLVGFQLGAGRSGSFHGLSLQASGKAGVFLNFNRQSVLSVSDSFTLANIEGDDVTLSSAIDLDFTASYALTETFRLRGGYQAVLLSSLAMGPDQIALLGDAAGSTAGGFINDDVSTSDASTVLFHGFYAGIEMVW